MVEALKTHAGEKAYLPGDGLPDLREAAASFLSRQGHALSAANILIGPGARNSFSIFWLSSLARC